MTLSATSFPFSFSLVGLFTANHLSPSNPVSSLTTFMFSLTDTFIIQVAGESRAKESRRKLIPAALLVFVGAFVLFSPTNTTLKGSVTEQADGSESCR